MSRAPSLAHRVEFALFRGATALGLRLGDDAADRLGAALGRLGYWPLRIRRRLVESQLRLAFPERDEAWIRRTAVACYAHIGREMLALLRSPGRTPAAVLARSRVAGLDAVREAVARGRGAIIVTGHLGNWEMAGAIVVASGIPLDVVVQRQHNPLFHRDIVAVREQLGMRVIERGNAFGDVLDALRAGRAVALVADQNAGRSGVFVPFFGRLASTHRGPALLALRSGAPLFVGCALRAPDGLYDATVDEVIVDRGGDPEAAVRRITAAYTARLEALVRRAPEQYFWVHKRWKTRPPEEQGRSREV